MRYMLAALLILALLSWSGASSTSVLAQDKDKKGTKEKNPEEGKKGTTVGLLVKKEKGGIEVKADGEEKARRFVPQWRGGAPAQGGGPDKDMLKTFEALKIGSRIEVDWVFEERLRSLKVTVLREPKEKDKDGK